MTPPPELVTIGDFRLIGRCEMASACGGDWWSYRQLPDGRVLLVVGDVTGHGMPSAMIAATGRGGDFMVLTSDGLTDRVSTHGTRFGEKRLRKTLVEEATRGTHDVRTLCERIVTEVNVFGGEQPVDDDITLVVVQYTGTASSGVSTSRRLRGAPIKRGAAA